MFRSIPPGIERSLDLWTHEHPHSCIKVESVMKYGNVSLIVRKVSRSHIYEVIIEVPNPNVEAPVK